MDRVALAPVLLFACGEKPSDPVQPAPVPPEAKAKRVKWPPMESPWGGLAGLPVYSFATAKKKLAQSMLRAGALKFEGLACQRMPNSGGFLYFYCPAGSLATFHPRYSTFYCRCLFHHGKLDHLGCGYAPKRDTARARRVEWEHVVPVSWFGRHRTCWRFPEKVCGKRMSGRLCCRKSDRMFRAMEADMVNLVPAIGELNAARGDREYGTVPGEPREYGQCDFEVGGVVELPKDRRGDAARIMLYMYYSYPGEFSEVWTREKINALWLDSFRDPVSVGERDRDRVVRVYQRGNPLVLGL